MQDEVEEVNTTDGKLHDVPDATQVTMSDGTEVSFRSNSNKKTQLSYEEGSVTFLFSNGITLSLTVHEVPGLDEYFTYQDNVKRFIMDGIRARIMANLAGAANVADAVQRNIEAIKNNEKPKRGPCTYRGLLSMVELTFATMYKRHPELFSGKQGEVDWENIEDGTVKKDIVNTWRNKSRISKNMIRKHPIFQKIYLEYTTDTEGTPHDSPTLD